MPISLNAVSFSYGTRPVLRDFSLTLPKSGVTCLFGASGCGKTTVLRLLLQLDVPQCGSVSAPEKPSAVFQEDRLLPWRTVFENVALAAEDRDAAGMLRAVGLSEEFWQKRPDQISGGQRRRVALARGLLPDSDCLLLDEPFTGLDAAAKAMAAVPILAYAAAHPVVLVTHQPEEIALLNATVVEMKNLKTEE